MKKLVFVLLFLLMALSSFSQQTSLQSLYDEFEVGATVRIADRILLIQDTIKISSTNMLFRISYLLKTTETYFKINKLNYGFIASEYDAIAYRTEQFLFIMKSVWVVEYYMSDSMKKSEMLNTLFKEQYEAFKTSQYRNLGTKQYK